MATRERPADIGRRRARELSTALGKEFREARLAAGLSQATVSRVAGLSRSQYGRIERCDAMSVPVDRFARIAAALGLELAMRVYLVGDPVRDIGQLRLTDRFRVNIGPGLKWSPEVPLPIPGDPRAWDGAITAARDWIAVEVETRLRDIQAVQRRVALKCRDSEVDRVILVLADTVANRRALAAGDASLRIQFPLGTREVFAALRAGRLPDRSGIVLC